jgi:uncharacterized protein
MENIANMAEIKEILERSQTIAVVGLSPKEMRPSNLVARYLIDVGYKVIPVNPGHDEILGQRCYPNLVAIDEPVDIVDIFRKPEEVLPIVDDAIAIGAKVIWMQFGVINHQAAARAKEAGLLVIMDRCLKIDHSDLF